MDQNYAVLEHIKDGCAVSSKYNSIILNFKTPNTLIVFSNSRPDTSSLSKDRWKIYSIDDDDGLKDTKTGKMIRIEDGNKKAVKRREVEGAGALSHSTLRAMMKGEDL